MTTSDISNDRRRRGEGSVSARADGRYSYRYRDVSGRRVSGYAATKADAERLLAGALAKRDTGVPAADRRSTLGPWLARWLETRPPGSLRPRSRVRYEYIVRTWQADPIGRVKLAELLPSHVAAAMNRQASAGASLHTVATNLSVLRMALKAAARDGRIGRNVAELVERPRIEPRRIDPPAGAELDRLRYAIAGDRLEPIWLLALDAGLRHGEILGLRWRDVDLAAGLVTVRGTLEEGTARVGPTKSRHGARRIPIAPSVRASLGRHAGGLGHHPDAFVFVTSSGRPYNATNVRREWHRLCDRASVRRYRIHDLRHAFATALLERWSMPSVSRYIGHATIKQTVDVYGHPDFAGLTFPEAAEE